MDNDFTTLSLEDYLGPAKEYLETESSQEFLNYVLVGRTENWGQVAIDPILNQVTEADGFNLSRDFDSLIGVHRDIIVENQSISLYPISIRHYTLSSNVHITYRFSREQGTFVAPLHHVPNLCVAKFGERNMIRVYIPELYDSTARRHSPFMTQEQQRQFYEWGLRPAVVDLMGDKAAEWPPSYNSEMWRARQGGALHFQTKMLDADVVGRLGDAIRDALSERGCVWHHGLVFLHQVRGMKHTTMHGLSIAQTQSMMKRFLEENRLSSRIWTSGDWWIDVGLEISSTVKDCLLWRSDSHFHLVKSILAIPDDQAARITNAGSSKYHRDITSHLPAIAGCRITPGPQAQGHMKVAYFQMYTTDKSVTYHPHGNYFAKHITAADTLTGKEKPYLEGLYDAYTDAMDKNYSIARIELRIPFRFCHYALRQLDEDLIRRSLLSFDPQVWWSWRAYRALALSHLLDWQSQGPTQYRIKPYALLLTATTTWLLNSLHATPDLGAASRELLTSVLPPLNRRDVDPSLLAFGSLVRAQESDSEPDDPNDRIPRRSAYPGFPFGAIFLPTLRLGEGYPVPRITSTVDELSDESLEYFFGHDLATIQQRLVTSSAIAPSNPNRTRNKVRVTQPILISDDTPMLFHLNDQGYRLPSPAREQGSDQSDVEMEDDEEDGAQDNRYAAAENIIFHSNDVDQVLNVLWGQFLHDLLEKAPNPSDAFKQSYCRLPEAERAEVDETAFKNTTLSDYFEMCRWKIGSTKDWNRVFDHLWLAIGKQKAGKYVQNYPSARYFQWWQRIKSDREQDTETLVKMRKAIRKRFDKLFWMPYAGADRIWNTKYAVTLQSSPGLTAGDLAPQIIVKHAGVRWVE